MKIVIDDKIPFIREAIAQMSVDAIYIKGADISADDVKDADAMIIRTRTHCDESLLRDSKVKFIATATIGFDHIDTEYLKSKGIAWTNCPGCNASSVRQYMESTLLLLERDFSLDIHNSTIGIVGCGHVGSLIKGLAEKMGMKVLVNDPLINNPEYVSLEEIEQRANIITFHVPMVRSGKYPTFHLADKQFFYRLERTPYIINTSRGGVVDNQALKAALNEGKVRQAIIDTWENEPKIDIELLNKVYIGTPHIAGYSADGKANADNMAIEALCKFFGISQPYKIYPPRLPYDFRYSGSPLELYNPLKDSEKLKNDPKSFEYLRGNYPLRRESYE